MNVNYLLATVLALTTAFGAAIAAETQPKPRSPSAEVGTVRLPDGTAFAGFSPVTNTPIYATPTDAPGLYTFDKGAQYCADLEANGHSDWRVPTKGELNELFQNRVAIGGFNESGSAPDSWYRSSSQLAGNLAWAQRFSDGTQGIATMEARSPVRCVRG
jgi:hypothetical protein